VTSGEVLIQLNTDFSTKGMDSQELQAVVAAWQSGAISRDTMFELFRKGEILPDGRTNQDEAALILAGNPKRETRNPNGTDANNGTNRQGTAAAAAAGVAVAA
jgi:Asp-tRNA(Asn)/Glu-tRNA(Gln) amidotransferase A subunit family amidase